MKRWHALCTNPLGQQQSMFVGGQSGETALGQVVTVQLGISSSPFRVRRRLPKAPCALRTCHPGRSMPRSELQFSYRCDGKTPKFRAYSHPHEQRHDGRFVIRARHARLYETFNGWSRCSQIWMSQCRPTRVRGLKTLCHNLGRSSYSSFLHHPIGRIRSVEFRCKTGTLFPTVEGSPCRPPIVGW